MPKFKQETASLLAPCSLLLAQEPLWFPVCSERTQEVPKHIRNWLAEACSLTARLERLVGGVQVKVLHQDWGRPFPSEAIRLQLSPAETIWIREVILSSRGEGLLLARTLAPAVTMAKVGKELTCLGDQPLGKLLFGRLNGARINVEWAHLTSACWLDLPERPCWGRRTLYQIAGCPLLVSEFFLPAILALEGSSDLV